MKKKNKKKENVMETMKKNKRQAQKALVTLATSRYIDVA